MKSVAGARRCVDLRLIQAARDAATMLLFRGFGDAIPPEIPSIMVSTAVLMEHLGVLQTPRLEDFVAVCVLAIAGCEAVKRDSRDAGGWHRPVAEAIMRGCTMGAPPAVCGIYLGTGGGCGCCTLLIRARARRPAACLP